MSLWIPAQAGRSQKGSGNVALLVYLFFLPFKYTLQPSGSLLSISSNCYRCWGPRMERTKFQPAHNCWLKSATICHQVRAVTHGMSQSLPPGTQIWLPAVFFLIAHPFLFFLFTPFPSFYFLFPVAHIQHLTSHYHTAKCLCQRHAEEI